MLTQLAFGYPEELTHARSNETVVSQTQLQSNDRYTQPQNYSQYFFASLAEFVLLPLWYSRLPDLFLAALFSLSFIAAST